MSRKEVGIATHTRFQAPVLRHGEPEKICFETLCTRDKDFLFQTLVFKAGEYLRLQHSLLSFEMKGFGSSGKTLDLRHTYPSY